MTKTQQIEELKEQLKKKDAEIISIQKSHHKQILLNEGLQMQYNGLKDSFYMIKKNYEREKNRLDGIIKTMYNQSKTQ
jgi:hypothetical protein